jgi:hypothetical protein
VSARDVVREAAARIDLSSDLITEIFDGAPLDFPIIFSRHLPFFVERIGMAGITLAGRVWLTEAAREHTPARLIALVRHEAEHVRQQRERPAAFYLRYGLGYLTGLVRPEGGIAAASRFDRAYRSIAYEREAYAAGARAWSLIMGSASAR